MSFVRSDHNKEKKNEEPDLIVFTDKEDESENVKDDDDDDDDESSIFDFNRLKLIEQPRMSCNMLPQTLEDCVGYIEKLPLVQPNADQRNPTTIVNMVNILSIPEAESILEQHIATTTRATATSTTAGADRNHHANTIESGEYKLYTDNYSESEPMATLLRMAQKKTVHNKGPLNLGHIVRPGCISFYRKFGVMYAVGEGRWWLPDINSRWLRSSRNVSLDQDVIQTVDNQVLIIRIIEGQVGLITVQGVHRLLDVGTHVFNSGTVQFCGRVTYSENPYFNHGPYHYMNVPRGKFAKVWVEVVDQSGQGTKSLVPRLLKEGEHFINSTFFQYKGLVDVGDEYIGHDAMHILNVVKGKIAKVFCDNQPRLLGEGLHVMESPNFSYQGTLVIAPDHLCIAHGTITILQVPRGRVALAWNRNEPYFIDKPGLYEFNSNDFHFVEFVDASERKIELGSKKVIQVYTGEVGITYDKGQLKILTNGRHVIDSSTHIFERFLSTKQRSIRLITFGASHKAPKSTTDHNNNDEMNNNNRNKWADLDDDADLLICETKDLVKVGVRADVFYSITDPNKCIQTLNTDELEDLVRETAVATLTNIIRSTALNQIAQSKQISASSGPDLLVTATPSDNNDDNNDVNDNDIEIHETQQETTSYFFDRAHDEFMSKLHEDFVFRYGVDIANIRMESFKIMDSELANEIAQNCLTTAHVENELSNLEGQNLIATQKERTAADCQNIKAAAEADSLKTQADAENKRKVDAAKAEGESLKVKTMAQAQAEADAILLKARAEAEAIRLKAAAEAERAKLLSQTSLGQQQSLLGIYADMVKTSNAGVNKVVYLDPSINRDSPFALGSLDGLNRDLHSVSKLGMLSSTTEKGATGN